MVPGIPTDMLEPDFTGEEVHGQGHAFQTFSSVNDSSDMSMGNNSSQMIGRLNQRPPPVGMAGTSVPIPNPGANE
jgi:hypothetical protein